MIYTEQIKLIFINNILTHIWYFQITQTLVLYDVIFIIIHQLIHHSEFKVKEMYNNINILITILRIIFIVTNKGFIWVKESIGAFYLSRLSFLTHIFFLDLIHTTQVHALLWDGSKSSYCIIKNASVTTI